MGTQLAFLPIVGSFSTPLFHTQRHYRALPSNSQFASCPSSGPETWPGGLKFPSFHFLPCFYQSPHGNEQHGDSFPLKCELWCEYVNYDTSPQWTIFQKEKAPMASLGLNCQNFRSSSQMPNAWETTPHVAETNIKSVYFCQCISNLNRSHAVFTFST